MMNRRSLLAAASLGPFSAIIGTGARAQGGTPVLRVVTPWEIGSLEPSRTGYVFSRMQVGETLLTADDGGLPRPGLATEWAMAADGLTWRLTLREGALFHDGTPVTAEIAAVALRRAKAQPGPFGTAPITAFETDGPRVLVVRTSEPLAALPAFLAHASTQILAPSSYDGDGTAVKRFIGSGSYRIVSIEPPLRMELERFDRWNGGPRPAIERASYQVVPRAETRTVMAESGQADLVFILDPPGQDRLRRSSRVKLLTTPVPRTMVVKLNTRLPFFDDLRAREAISLLIDRDGIARSLLRLPGNAATQMFSPSQVEWHVSGLPLLTRDVTAAQRLLSECGWMPGPDGVRVRHGKPFRVTLRTFTDRPELPVVASALQENLREGGIDMQVSVANSSEIPAGHRDGSLEMALFARSFSVLPDPVGTLVTDYAAGGGDWGAMGWSDPGLVGDLAKLTATSDPAERARLRGAAASILHQQLPLIPVAWYETSLAASKRVTGVSLDPLELSYRLSDMAWAS